jgi:hypothetical protein
MGTSASSQIWQPSAQGFPWNGLDFGVIPEAQSAHHCLAIAIRWTRRAGAKKMSAVTADRHPASRRSVRVAVVIVTLAAAAVGAVVFATDSGRDSATSQGLTATLHLPGTPDFVLATPTSLWVSTSTTSPSSANQVNNGALLQINLATGTVQRTLPLPGQNGSLVGYGSRVIADPGIAGEYNNVFASPGELLALDSHTGHVLARRREQVGSGPLAVGAGHLWSLLVKPAALEELNLHTLAPVAPPLALSAGRAYALAWGDGYLWVSASDDGAVLRIDPVTRVITRIHVGGFPIGITAAGGSVWVIDNANATVLRLNPTTLKPVGQPIHTPSGGAYYISATDGYVFIANDVDGTITRINDLTGKITGLPVRIASTSHTSGRSAAYAVAPAGNAIWATSQTTDSVSRIQAQP